MEFITMWTGGTEQEWHQAVDRYWRYVKPGNMKIELEMAELERRSLQSLTAEEFYEWLYKKYFVWKYTQANRLATTRKSLERRHGHPAGLDKLHDIQCQIFTINTRENPDKALENAGRIGGLGMPGASGLLAVLFPEDFGTVDQFVVENLLQIPDYGPLLPKIRANGTVNITPSHALFMINVFREKVVELNRRFQTDYWTPRRLDMALWGTRAK